ncbi:MAG: glycosyltransferase family 2 protein [Desulfamplus sp.]|nr:glycosyltransferase family 2 protein [Desulfamplus sp.]
METSYVKGLVTVVIPTYNNANLLATAIQSVLNQTYKNWEIIVIDNYSNDNTEEVVNSFDETRIRFLKFRNNGVIAASRNLGIDNAQGEWIAFLDSDDWWGPKKLEESVSYLKNGYDFVYHDCFCVNKKKQMLFLKKLGSRDLNPPVYEDLLLNGNPIFTSSVVTKKNILESVGKMSEKSEKITWEDYDTWLLIAQITEKFKRIPKTLGYYWVGEGKTLGFKRNIDNIDSFLKVYKEELEKRNLSSIPWWTNYAKGVSYYYQGEYLLAKNYLKRVKTLKSRPRFFLNKLRKIIMIELLLAIRSLIKK